MKNSLILYLLASFSICLLCCSKSSQNPPVTPNPPPVKTPAIVSAGPLTGGFTTQLTIIGKNFSTDSAADVVKINGKQAIVLKANADTIIVSIPLAAGTGAVTLTINGTTVTGPVFTYTSGLVVTTYAGNGIRDQNNGASTITPINNPMGIAVDLQGNVYVSEFNRIKKITPSGDISVLAGNGVLGYKDTIGAYAEFKYPTGLAVDVQGNVFVADRDNTVIRKITPDGVVSTFACSSPYGYADGIGTDAKFWGPNAIAIDKLGNLFVTDYGNKRIRKITPDGTVSTLAGDGVSDFRDGPGDQAEFFDIEGIAVDQQENVYVAELWNARIRKITPDGFVSTFAGTTTGFVGGYGYPHGIATDADGNVYVGHETYGMISKLTPTGINSVYAGTGTEGYTDGPVVSAQFKLINCLAADALGNLYVSDEANYRIRKITFQ